MTSRLEDLIEDYPEPEELTQDKISRMRELAELATPADFRPRRSTVKGTLFQHQLLFQRLALLVRNLILMADTGTGKTCSFVGLMEHCFSHPEENIDHGYFFTGPAQIEDFKDQLVCKCNPASKYLTQIDAKTERRSQNKILNDLVRPLYTPTSYTTFVNRHFTPPFSTLKRAASRRVPTDAELRTQFARCVFFLDEVQKIKINPQISAKSARAILGDISYYRVSTGLMPSETLTEGGLKSHSSRVRLYNYLSIWRLLHVLEDGIKVVSSARPITNYIDEFIFIANLVLPLNKQLYHPLMEVLVDYAGMADRVNWVRLDLTQVTTHELRDLLGPRMLYFRGFKTEAVPDFSDSQLMQYPPPEGVPEQAWVFPFRLAELSPFQQEIYLNIEREQEARLDFGSIYKNDFAQRQREAINFVFPDGRYDLAAFNQHLEVEEHGLNIRLRRSPQGDMLGNTLNQPRGLQMLSAKFYAIVKAAYEQPGKRYVYSRFLRAGGAYLLGLALQAGHPDLPAGHRQGHGYFQQFSQSKISFRSSSKAGSSSFCGASEEAEPIGIERTLRYAFVNDENKRYHSAIFRLFNSKANLDGQYIKVIIVSGYGKEGVNFADVMHEDIIEPDFSPAAQYQAENRIFRATSHQNLVVRQSQRQFAMVTDPSQRLLEGGDLQPQIRVKVNYWVGALTGPAANYISIDSRVYQYTRFKDIQIGRFIHKCKQVCVDCMINKAHNFKPDDRPFSYVCDYQACQIQCVDEELVLQGGGLGSDYRTYDVYYAGAHTAEIVDKWLKPYFALHSETTLAELTAYSGYTVEAKYFQLALEKIILERQRLQDRFGFWCYLVEVDGIFYLLRQHPRVASVSSLLSSYYNTNLVGVRPLSLAELTLQRWSFNVALLWNWLAGHVAGGSSASPGTSLGHVAGGSSASLGQHGELSELLLRLDNNQRVALLESAISLEVLGLIDRVPVAGALLSYYTKSVLAEVSGGRGAAGDMAEVKPAKFSRYVHKLYNPYHEGTAHGSQSQFERVKAVIRILDVPASLGSGDFQNSDPQHLNALWRDASEVESDHYRAIFQDFIRKTTSQVRAQGEISGSINDKKEFVITSPGHTGIRCEASMKVPELINIMDQLGIPPGPRTTESRELMLQQIGNKKTDKSGQPLTFRGKTLPELTDDELWYVYYNLTQGSGRNTSGRTNVRAVMCPKIQRRLEELGRMFYQQ